jgi:hypothetical protein
MMELLQNFDAGTGLLLAVGLCALCLVGGILAFGLQIIGLVAGTLGNVLEIFFEVLGGGPVAWCGCIALIFFCAACAGGALLFATMVSTCGTPEAVNFCSFFGG